jgi:hypothetical protein
MDGIHGENRYHAFTSDVEFTFIIMYTYKQYFGVDKMYAFWRSIVISIII